jgi:Bacterial dnaA protein helix-turn-helix
MVRVDDIVQIVAFNFDQRPHDMLSHVRSPAVTRARHVAMYLARQHTSYSSPDIGRVFGVDHTTVLAAVAKMELELKDVQFAGRVKAITSIIDYHEKLGAAGEIDVLDIAHKIMKNPMRNAGSVGVYQIAALAKMFLEVWEIAKAGEAISETIHQLTGEKGQDERDRLVFIQRLSKAVLEDMASIHNPSGNPEEQPA